MLNIPHWFIGFVLLASLLCCYFIFKKCYQIMNIWLKPFKKGKRYRCKVIRVYDGDTVTVQRFNLRRSQTSIRMAYIDAPELKQSYGNESREAMKRLVEHKWVKVRVLEVDKYGHSVSEIHRGSKNINEIMIKQGAAWAYPDYIRNAVKKQKLVKLQADAQKHKRGLWKSGRAQSPQTYRRKSA